MITDEMLAAAAGEVSDAMVGSIPLSEHVFSPGFEKQMGALVRRAAHPVRRQVLRYAAAVLIAAVTAFSGLYLLSPTVRAAVNSWVRTAFGSYVQYYSEETAPPDVEYDYFLPQEFNGYTLQATVERDHGKAFIYVHADGSMLLFEYMYGGDSNELFLDADNCILESDSVGNFLADIYCSQTADKSSVIVWKDPAANLLFYINAVAEKNELIEFAKKVEKYEKNKN